MINKIATSKLSTAALFNYLGVVLGYLNLILLLPAVFSPEAIGQYQVVTRFGVLVGSILCVGIPAAVNRYAPIWSLLVVRNKVIRNFKYGVAGFLLIGLALAYFFPSIFPLADSPFHIIACGIILAASVAFKNVYLSILRVEKKIGQIAFFTDVFVRSLVLIFALVCLTQEQLLSDVLVYAYLLFEISGAVILSVIAKSVMQQTQFTEKREAVNKKELAQFLGYSLLTVIGSSLVLQIDTIMVAELSVDSFKATAIYSIAFFIATVVEIPRRAIGQIAVPTYAEAFACQNTQKVITVYRSSALLQSITSIIAFTIIWCNIDDLFSIISNGDIYAEGKMVVFFIGLARVIDLSFGANNELISNSKFFRFNLFALLILAGINFCLNILLIKEFDFLGAAVATCISLTVFNIAKLIKISRERLSNPFTWIHLVFIVSAAILIALVNPVFPNVFTASIPQIILKSGCYLVVFLPILFIFRKKLIQAYQSLK